MWRGTLYSSLLHGSIVVALFAGLPILPSIFERDPKTENDSAELPISVEVVSAESIDLRQNVIAPASRETASAAVPGKLQPLVLAQPDGAQQTDAPPPAGQSAARTHIPEGSLARPQSDRTVQSRPSTFHKRPAERSQQPQPVRSPAPARRTEAAARASSAPEMPLETPPKTSLKTPASRDNSNVRADTLTVRALASVAPVPTTAQSPGPGNTPETTPAPPAPAAARNKPAPAIPPPTTAPAAKGGTAAGNAFVQAVSGRKRDLVVKLLGSDDRLRQAVTPRPGSVPVPEQARQKTRDRLEKAANAGFSHAQYNLAGKFLRGEDVPVDRAQALKWISRAAQQGYTPAQTLLGLMRYTGLGVPQDQAESAFWWSLAADAGNEGAKTAAALLKNQLKPRELVKSRRLRARWGSLINDLADSTAGDTNRRDIDKALRTAAEQGDIDAVLSLLARGADADKAGSEGRTAVINAAWRGRGRIIQLLLDRGVATELPDDGGRTPLMWAAINGHDDIVDRLVQSGANPNQPDKQGGTALIRAAWNGHISVVRNLIGAGADLNARDDNGLTALAHANREGNTTVVKALRDAGAR